MGVPARLTASELASALSNLGYSVTHKSASHVRLTTFLRGEHHVTVPDEVVFEPETVTVVLTEVARHHRVPYEEVVQRSF
jgi:hypothetical protein